MKVVRTPEKPRTTSVAPITPVTPEATLVITMTPPGSGAGYPSRPANRAQFVRRNLDYITNVDL